MYDALAHKILLIHFWTSSSVDCLQVLTELQHLEDRFRDHPGVVFISCHSAKFDNEKDLEILRAHVRKYDVKHPVIHDCDLKIWKDFGCSSWPTTMLL